MQRQSAIGQTVRLAAAFFEPRRRWASLVACAVLGAACERPEYTYSDVAVAGIGAGASAASPAVGAASGVSMGGSAATETCALDRGGAAPIFQAQAISDELAARPVVYAELTDAELVTLQRDKTVLPASAAAPSSTLPDVLTSLAAVRVAESALLLDLATRFRATRATWANPWALRLNEHPGSEHMNAVRIRFKQDAWFGRIVNGSLAVTDIDNVIVPLASASSAPERIAAIYYVATGACTSGKRELLLGNEAMVEELSAGTPEIVARLDSDVAALSQLFQAVRRCPVLDTGSATFQESTACQTWSFFDPSSEFFAYAWALSTPSETYKPTPQNLSTLVQALLDDAPPPASWVAMPKLPAGAGGSGGSGGAPF